MKQQQLAALIGGMIFLAGATHAHPGHDHVHGLAHGLTHPIFGMDHLLAMIGVGLWAAQRGGRAVWALPTVFVGSMAIGGALGLAAVPMLAVEAMIVLSVLVMGLMVAGSTRLPIAASLAMVSLFACMHGYAHGAELTAGDGAAGYAAGFLIATAALHASGVACAIALKKLSATRWIRYSGGAIAAMGLAMIIGLI